MSFAAGAISSVGRASRLHREGRRFEPVIAHHYVQEGHSGTMLMLTWMFSAALKTVSLEILLGEIVLSRFGGFVTGHIRV